MEQHSTRQTRRGAVSISDADLCSMESETARYRHLVDKLQDSLDNLEETLEPLLSKPLAETSAGFGSVLDEAKLNVLVPFLVHDLIFGKCYQSSLLQFLS
jgi:hypothetical protein